MGYTHYWEVSDAITDKTWQGFCQDVKKVLAATDIPVQREYDDTSLPTVDNKIVMFNGVGDDGHETFYVSRNQKGFEFCKTARKPYDAVVVACILIAVKHGVFSEWSSDGNGEAGYTDEARKLLRKSKVKV